MLSTDSCLQIVMAHASWVQLLAFETMTGLVGFNAHQSEKKMQKIEMESLCSFI